MLPSILAKQLEKGIGDYIETTYPMTNEPFKGSVENLLGTQDAVYHEPYVSVRLPFRVVPQMCTCFEAVHPKYIPYVHQQKAFDRLTGDHGRSTLVATGTGSGKTECFLYPILEYCYQHRGEQGIKALIIYPMNALASDQAKRIAELIYETPELRGNVRVGMYVGGEEGNSSMSMTEHSVITDHDTMLNYAPDILLTNYKMLDYLLVRQKDTLLWQDNGPETLKYIAVDELHTFDGAQGTDLACLLRRLKSRLSIEEGWLCCIGTSATMGSKDNNDAIVKYASDIFGEVFDSDSVITEDRLSKFEFFEGMDVTCFAMPNKEQTKELQRLADEEDLSEYLRFATNAWFPGFTEDVLSNKGRVMLGKALMHHGFMQAMIILTGGEYCQVSKMAEDLSVKYPDLRDKEAASVVLDSLYALISHARTDYDGELRPFLYVQVQVWMRELRRLMAKVDPDTVTYEIESELNGNQVKEYLPVVNCRDCGITGWVSILNEKQNATMTNIKAFYNKYFKADDRIVMMFPKKQGENMAGMMTSRLCPKCLQVYPGDNEKDECSNCGAKMMDVFIPNPIHTSGTKEHKQYVCPCCGSRRGLSLMGLRSATEISASISQMFASRFNDDKKTLAFSDNVQDAAHRAGFFNSRTWKFGLRTAMQRYCEEYGAGKSLLEFQNGFIQYWRDRMTDEKFVGFFTAPNMTYRHAYEEMIKKRSLGNDNQASILLMEIEQRLKYEIILEYGLTGRIGRTLEKSGCSVLSFDPKDIQDIAKNVQERSVNELGVLVEESTEDYEHMVIGYLNLMRMNGAFDDPVFEAYTKNHFNGYMLSNDYNRWLPGRQSGRNTPRFIVLSQGGRKLYDVDTVASSKYTDWIASCRKTFLVEKNTYADVGMLILEEAVKQGVVSILPSSPEYKVFGLNKNKVYVSSDVVQMRCDTCGSLYSVSEEDLEFWKKAPCLRSNCGGILQEDPASSLGYYGKLYSIGDLERINAREHTGLLKRKERDILEEDFKRKIDERKAWDPNVLSCTPTMEMGIDIGDLSTVILCNMPPSQSQFLQRAGRAGRKDGNALTFAIANARPHDLYYYADPLDMISGNVTPPKVFLRASAVLERQFIAFCMDSWVKREAWEEAIPNQVKVILSKLDLRLPDTFPFNFLNYVERSLSYQLDAFICMFAKAWGTEEESEEVRSELYAFARGDDKEKCPMYINILDAFVNLKKQQDSLLTSIHSLKDMIKELEAKPKDSSYDQEIKELQREKNALIDVLQKMGEKNVYNFLSEEGLLPNYAFPEAGIMLKAVLYRKEEEPKSTVAANERRNYDKTVYEYVRSASAALSEFAPNNSFYADGRKLTIDQVDLTTVKADPWRLCPNCAHAQLEEKGKHTAACPKCGSPAWTDAGQVRNMLRVQMVYSNMDYTKSMINDENEDRSTLFYCKQLLVDVDEDNDITMAYQMDNNEFQFGYEFVRKATLREINFGESDTVGEKMSVSGVEDVRKGFKICQYCGKIQPSQGAAIHSRYCKTQKNPALLEGNAYEECLFLYREFDTEVLRILVPATTSDITSEKLDSFVAAFMLGMKEYFGNVDHLGATISEVPVPESNYRKQYLVIYDSVPGGTGYLKQLMHEKNAFIEILEKALDKMENCSCRNDPEKKGCYHCLYAYRQSQQIGNISRATAVNLLRTILSGKDSIRKIEKINEISVNPLIESELERRFLGAVKAKAGSSNVSDTMRNGKHCYYVKLGNLAWEIEPQVLLGPENGVKVKSKPDFILWPKKAPGHLPVAVFTDGFTYHKDIAADDTLKREAIRRSENFRVWSLSFKDIQTVYASQTDYATDTLDYTKMPSGVRMYLNTVKKEKAEDFTPSKMTPFDQMFFYLSNPDAERLFRAHAYAYGLSLLEPTLMKNQLAFSSWNEKVAKIQEQTNYAKADYAFARTAFGTWKPRQSNSSLTIYGGIALDQMKMGGMTSVWAVLKDEKENRSDVYEKEWNALLQFSNVMQFSDEYISVSTTGLAKLAYLALPVAVDVSGAIPASENVDEGWDVILDSLFDEESKAFAKAARNAGIPAPEEDNIGYEVIIDGKVTEAMVEIAWPEWKIGYLTSEQAKDQEMLESNGWKLIDLLNIEEAKSMFGGKDK